jgi:hypothetical protein
MADTVGGRGVGTDSDVVGENESEIVVVVYVTCWEACYGDGLVC